MNPKLRHILTICVLLLAAVPASAQQGRGIFFSIFGHHAPQNYGDFNNTQAFYFDIPESETRPVYLRLFDAEVGGRYDERHGRFDTETRFLVVGGASANRIYRVDVTDRFFQEGFQNIDLIYDRTYATEGEIDGRWMTIGQLELEKGYDLGNGYRRFALLVEGLSGDDSNFFDLALSYSTTAKEPPATAKTFVYDLSLRIPSLLLHNEPEFQGQIKLHTEGRDSIRIATFDMDDVPINMSVPLRMDSDLKTSGDGNWVWDTFVVPDHENVKWVGLNFFGRNFNNTFALVYEDMRGTPLPIQLPILDYEPLAKPEFVYQASYDPFNCFAINFDAGVSNPGSMSEPEITWVIAGDTVQAAKTSMNFDSLGYNQFTVSFYRYARWHQTYHHLCRFGDDQSAAFGLGWS